MRKRTVLTLFLIVLLVGAGLRVLPVRTGYHYWDETVYLQHGKIISGERPAELYNELDFRPPFIGLLTGAVFALGGSTTAIHVLISLLAAAAIPLTYLLGRELWSAPAGLLAAAAVALSPEHFIRSHFVLVDAILPTVWLLTALSTLYLHRTGKREYAVLTGALAGTAVLIKFTSLVLPAAVLTTLVLARVNRYTVAQVQDSLRETVRDRNTWITVASFTAILLPYLAWSALTYGNPVHTFATAMAVADISRPFLTYVSGAGMLLPLAFLAGALLFLPHLRKPGMGAVLPTVFMLSLAVPAHVWPNKELRLLLPVIPFAAVMAGAGFDSLQKRKPALLAVTAIALVILSIPPITSHDYTQRLKGGGLTFSDAPPPTYDAAQWLERETAVDTTVYANDRWAELAYYSERRVRVVPLDDTLVQMSTTTLRPGGHIVYYPDSTAWAGPNLTTLHSSPQYELRRSFNGGRIQVFQISAPES